MALKDVYTAEMHATLQVKDLEEAKKFYQDVLELTLVDDIPDFGWASVQSKLEGAKIGLSLPQDGNVVVSNVVNLHVSDLEKAKSALDGKGVTTGDMIDFPNMISMFSIKDPTGNTITFIGAPRKTE